MTTLLHKTNAHKKARALSSGFWKLIKASILTPRQGLQGLASECISLVIDHENNNSISIIDIASIRARKSISVGFIPCEKTGGGPCIITCIT